MSCIKSASLFQDLSREPGTDQSTDACRYAAESTETDEAAASLHHLLYITQFVRKFFRSIHKKHFETQSKWICLVLQKSFLEKCISRRVKLLLSEECG